MERNISAASSKVVTAASESKINATVKSEVRFLRVKRLLHNKLAVFGLIVITLMILVAIFAPVLAPDSPYKQDLITGKNLGIGAPGHLLGTDNYGRDLLSRVIYGARISLGVGFSAVAIGLSIGVVLGLIAGYFQWLDGLIMRCMDVLFAFPGILLALLIIAILGTGIGNIVIAISIWAIPTFARIVRGSVLAVKNEEYITALKSEGARAPRIIFKHILPNCMAPIIVNATMRLGSAILSTAALSFIGLGAQPPSPEWGAMIAEGQSIMWDAPQVAVVPGIAIMLVIFSFNVFGDGLRDALDPNAKIR
ncbi:ABC transporter permease [Lacticaseibacillus casei]|jgi:peptide/nickel transport system permease protein|uniref:Glutathione transport system permease protein GsiD n=1 Tax=Lacticaseibacillus huelsenbergensis TaxID=3035291 RepID=A0ABY8DTZ7_9LACO|nr:MULTISPECIES: ABC transporter permease [Lacticaseibacillus]MDG3062208.1 ABC transporter permease [Lacticaseibacillus sp. BCRC 81376]QVI36255.1 ABC transporter permease [Lacticaseibacillus casei]QXG58052.1 ABC transporter permease [Lacticaseibacillus casei]WFB40474.1 ABC transporter permease [Lacticaseibacillus huelsenbergensis]WFB42224.1 ABC transporter permease [Lacticaseibacillus huelsenbergensis]